MDFQINLETIKDVAYRYITELGRRVTICGANERKRNIYVSTSHSVEITLLPKEEDKFLIQYKGNIGL